MKVEFIEPFVKSVYTVLEAVVGDKPERGKLALRNTTFTTQQVTIMAGVNGDVEGAALYGMSMSTATKIASAMMGSPVAELDEMASSAICELGNMITGSATTMLSQNGFQVDITPPSVIRGANVEVSTRTAALVVPVQTEHGAIEINVALTENAMRKAAYKNGGYA
ncbi:MAG: chemotaxis protein CheX [Armatimonadetes bacterium]|nr:chemotaxis protein CheX [Armatimonadota bacterium]